MAVFKCKMCGGDLEITEKSKVAECMYCGTRQTVPALDNEKKLNLFNRANRLRLKSEFDAAATIYENIIAEFPEEAEAYWGLCLCNYGIEYVDDPITGRKIPTCHRASFEPLQNDENFELAMEYGDLSAQALYRTEAVEIDRIMDEFLAISKNEEPYDIFICYKETDENGSRTVDSLIAENLYNALTEKDYRVFFARISLEDKLGRQYEPYIFAALNSARVMLCVGSKYEYFNAPWVKNEWSRFLKLSGKDRRKLLIPCYKDIDPYLLPSEFKALQAQDMGKVGAQQDIIRGLDKIFDRSPLKPAGQNPMPTSEKVTPPVFKLRTVRNVCSIGTNDEYDCWPEGQYSEFFDRDEFSVIFVHIFVVPEFLSYATSVNVEWRIYNERGDLVFEDEADLEWNKDYDRISKGWIIKGDEGDYVASGKYVMKCSVEDSQEYEYEFRVFSRTETQMKRRLHNLCQHCGNQFRQTIFGVTKCSKCGRHKDY